MGRLGCRSGLIGRPPLCRSGPAQLTKAVAIPSVEAAAEKRPVTRDDDEVRVPNSIGGGEMHGVVAA